MNWTPHVQPLTAADGEDMAALQQLMLEHLPSPRWYYPSTAAEFAALADQGYALGIRKQGRLIALNVALPARRNVPCYAASLGRDDPDTLDFLDIIVDPAYRRQGIHSHFLALREEEARAGGMSGVYATVDPENQPSLRAFAKQGYVPLATLPAYDGRPRVYLYKALFP